MESTSDGLVVSFALATGDEDTAVLIIGRKNDKQDVEIINAIQGKEAVSLYNTLITKKVI